MVEIAFQICTSYHPDLPEQRPLTGWFPCVTSGNRLQDEGNKQPKGTLERENEVWLKVSGPNGFFVKAVDRLCVCTCVCICVCINDALKWLVRKFPFVIQRFYIFRLFSSLLECWTLQIISLSKCSICTGKCKNQKFTDQ